MEHIINAKNTTVTPAIRAYIEKRFAKFAKYANEDMTVHTKIEVKDGGLRHKVEVTIQFGKQTVRAEANDTNMYVAIDNVEKTVSRQLKKRKEKLTQRYHAAPTEPVAEDVSAVVGKAVEYMKRRSPAKVKYSLSFPDTPLSARLNVSLMEWVFENLCKNAIDAMEGCGEISVVVSDAGDKVQVDVTDTGKGIAKSRWKMIFEPGFTTKPRGWGLGLSLAKRIVEEFHKGRIYIKKSAPGKGTTFRIELKK